MAKASIRHGEFHDLRCTCLTRWFENGLSEFDVMKLAGHSDFSTTHRFYLAVRRDLLDRARKASEATMSRDFGTHLARTPIPGENTKKPTITTC
ncbi:tyrosine-type recombinase/integrase [Planctomycetota bacterium]